MKIESYLSCYVYHSVVLTIKGNNYLFITKKITVPTKLKFKQ